MKKQIDFFFSCASTYTYLAVMRAADIAAASNVHLRWRPFNLRAIMTEQNNRPFLGKPVKTGYMWRDLQRCAARHDIAFAGIPKYPIESALLTRVAVLAASEGWCPAFAKAHYHAWFIQHRDPGDVSVLAQVLTGLGRDPTGVLQRADAQENLDRCEFETQAARDLGIFGSPNFVVGKEVYWGNDRLEHALDWCRSAKE